MNERSTPKDPQQPYQAPAGFTAPGAHEYTSPSTAGYPAQGRTDHPTSGPSGYTVPNTAQQSAAAKPKRQRRWLVPAALLEGVWRDRGLTLVIVTHDSAVAARAQRRLHIADGHVTEATSTTTASTTSTTSSTNTEETNR